MTDIWITVPSGGIYLTKYRLNVFVCSWVAISSDPSLLLLLQEHHLRFNNNTNLPCCLKGKKQFFSLVAEMLYFSQTERNLLSSSFCTAGQHWWELSPPECQYFLCMLSSCKINGLACSEKLRMVWHWTRPSLLMRWGEGQAVFITDAFLWPQWELLLWGMAETINRFNEC